MTLLESAVQELLSKGCTIEDFKDAVKELQKQSENNKIENTSKLTRKELLNEKAKHRLLERISLQQLDRQKQIGKTVGKQRLH